MEEAFTSIKDKDDRNIAIGTFVSIAEKYEKVIVTQNSQNKEFRINAIVDDFAFINETWIKKNEKIEDYKLIKIDRNFVVLSNESNEIKLELLNEEYFKENN